MSVAYYEDVGGFSTMKVLYASDLDGTLLNKNQELDEHARFQLNQLIENGVNFTVATGRGCSVQEILNDVHFKYPLMLLNGTLNYDCYEKKYVDKVVIPNNIVLKVINVLKYFDYKTFQVDTLVDNQLNHCNVFDWNGETDCLTFNVLLDTANSHELSQILSNINGIDFFIHKKVYSSGESFCDIVAENVSKASRLKLFKEQYGFDKVIAFGDSENDLPMASVADEFYAVDNAVDIVKENATGIIGSCYDNGVVNFILENEKKLSTNVDFF